jgi:hypothetical protein
MTLMELGEAADGVDCRTVGWTVRLTERRLQR